MKNGLILGRVTRKLEKIGNEDPENKEMKALMHHQSKLEIMNGRLEAESSNIEHPDYLCQHLRVKYLKERLSDDPNTTL